MWHVRDQLRHMLSEIGIGGDMFREGMLAHSRMSALGHGLLERPKMLLGLRRHAQAPTLAIYAEPFVSRYVQGIERRGSLRFRRIRGRVALIEDFGDLEKIGGGHTG